MLMTKMLHFEKEEYNLWLGFMFLDEDDRHLHIFLLNLP